LPTVAGEAEFQTRACCAAGAESGLGITEPIVSGDFQRLARGPVLAAVPSQPDEATAIHESGHAAIAFGLGGTIRQVRIAHPGQAEYDGAFGDADRIAISYAGPAAEHASRRWEITVSEREERQFLDRAAACSLGSCDFCSMALFAARLASATETNPSDHFRTGQLLANALVRLPAVKRAITALAAALVEQPVLDGAAAEAILSQFLERGELAPMEFEDASENPSRTGGDHLSTN
jgi:hypothetical protein